MASRSSFSRRQSIKLGAGALAAASLASRGFGPASAQGVKLINVEHDSRPLDNAAYAAVYEVFRESNPDIEIDFQIIPWEQARPKLLTQAQGNELPDVGRLAWAPDFAAADMIVPIEDRVDQATLDRFHPIQIDQASALGNDGERHLYGLPWFAGSHSILVNKTVLDQAGLPLLDEWTTEQFAEYAQALTIEGEQWGVAMAGSGIGDPVQVFLMSIYAHGGKWVAGDPGSTEPEPIVFDSQETVDGIKWYCDLYLNGLAVPSAPTDTYKERDANFQSGKAAMEWQGPWSLTEIDNNFTQGGFELASMPLPKGPAGVNPTSLGGGLMGIYRGAEDRGVVDQAFAWANFMSSDEGQILYCKTNGMIPASKTAQADPFWTDNPLYKGYLGSMAGATMMEPVWATNLISICDDIVPPLIQGVMLGEVSPEDAADQIQSEVVRGLQQIGINVPD
jgi:ABC-type glycerol-3-phosphate transport system substrate-binding protein